MEAGALLEGKRFCHGGRNRVLPVWCLHLVVKLPSRITGLGNRTAPGRAPSPPPPAVARPAPSGPSSWGQRQSSLYTGPAFDTMELRMPVGHPGAAVGGGDAFDGPGFFALNAAQQQQSALFAFWTAPGEFLVRVTHPAFVQWLVPAGIYFADPTAAGQSCASSHMLESLFLGACRGPGPGHRRHGGGPVRGCVRYTVHTCGSA